MMIIMGVIGLIIVAYIGCKIKNNLKAKSWVTLNMLMDVKMSFDVWIGLTHYFNLEFMILITFNDSAS